MTLPREREEFDEIDGSELLDHRRALRRRQPLPASEQVRLAVGAKLVIPIHWDDFSRSLDRPLVPMPRLMDDLAVTMDRLKAHLAPQGCDLAFLRPFEQVPILPLRR